MSLGVQFPSRLPFGVKTFVVLTRAMILIGMTKVCITCKDEKDVEEFAFRSFKENIRLNTCKECHRQYTKRHYKRNRKKYLQRVKDNRTEITRKNAESLKQKMLNFLRGKQCVDCGEDDIVVLEFDHRDGTEKEATVAQLSKKSWRRTLDEIQKCDIRCANCHRRKTAKQLGWYRYMKTEVITVLDNRRLCINGKVKQYSQREIKLLIEQAFKNGNGDNVHISNPGFHKDCEAIRQWAIENPEEAQKATKELEDFLKGSVAVTTL